MPIPRHSSRHRVVHLLATCGTPPLLVSKREPPALEQVECGHPPAALGQPTARHFAPSVALRLTSWTAACANLPYGIAMACLATRGTVDTQIAAGARQTLVQERRATSPSAQFRLMPQPTMAGRPSPTLPERAWQESGKRQTSRVVRYTESLTCRYWSAQNAQGCRALRKAYGANESSGAHESRDSSGEAILVTAAPRRHATSRSSGCARLTRGRALPLLREGFDALEQ